MPTRDHAKVRPSLTEDMAGAAKQVALLGELGIDLNDVTAQLLREGVESFTKSFESLMATLKKKIAQVRVTAGIQISAKLKRGEANLD